MAGYDYGVQPNLTPYGSGQAGSYGQNRQPVVRHHVTRTVTRHVQPPARQYQPAPTRPATRYQPAAQLQPVKPAYNKQAQLQQLYANKQKAIANGDAGWLGKINTQINTLKYGKPVQQHSKPAGYGRQQPARPQTRSTGYQQPPAKPAPQPVTRPQYKPVTNMQSCRDNLQMAYQAKDKGAIATYTKQMNNYRGNSQQAQTKTPTYQQPARPAPQRPVTYQAPASSQPNSIVFETEKGRFKAASNCPIGLTIGNKGAQNLQLDTRAGCNSSITKY